MTGAELIAAERRRQVGDEGWTPGHDDEHDNESLAMAAVCYARRGIYRPEDGSAPAMWPWSEEWWKPSPDDRVRELVKAGALIAAEIDRLLRAGLPKAVGSYWWRQHDEGRWIVREVHSDDSGELRVVGRFGAEGFDMMDLGGTWGERIPEPSEAT